MGRYSDFAYIWYIDSRTLSEECSHCGKTSSYSRDEISSAGFVRCKKCGSMFRLGAAVQS